MELGVRTGNEPSFARRPAGAGSIALVVFGLAFLTGCGIVFGTYKVEETIGAKDAGAIRPGQTTKQEILDRFGPPVAIARPGKTMRVPHPGIRKTGSEELPSETFLELFSGKHRLTEYHVVYYYYSAETRGSTAIVAMSGATSTTLAVNKLWVLVNDKTGIAEDYVLREQD